MCFTIIGMTTSISPPPRPTHGLVPSMCRGTQVSPWKFDAVFFFMLAKLTLQLEMMQSFALRITLVYVHPVPYIP